MRHPDVPETLDGWSILHRMFRFRRRAFDALPEAERDDMAEEAVELLSGYARSDESDAAVAQMLGHKSDVMFTHYAHSFDELASAQTAFDASPKMHAELRSRELKPHSPEWTAAFDDLLALEAAQPRNAARLWSKIPQRRYVCFYPMDKKRGEAINWYRLPYEERAKMMVEHGKIGRSFHGLVTQVISGSIGFDDFEWGVDLYADDPLVFKKLIYEMRFDEASARYAAFGPFYTGVQFSLSELPHFLEGDGVPELKAAAEPALN